MEAAVCWFVTFWSVLAWGAVTQRRALDALRPAEFNPRDHLREAYREAVEWLCGGEGTDPPAAVEAACRTLAATLNQQRLLGELEAEARDLELSLSRQGDADDREERERLLAGLGEVIALVRAGRYVLSVPVEFETDSEERVWRVWWPTWSGDDWRGGWTGPEVRRTVQFIPRMDLVVEAEFGRSQRGEPGWGYRIRNGRDSEADVARIWIECVGLNPERIAMLAGSPHRWDVGDGFVRFALPGSMYRQDFILRVFGPDGLLVIARPGESLRIPTELSVPWPSLPGVVVCWVEARLGYPLNLPQGIDAEQDPDDVMDLFRRGGECPSPAVGHSRSVPRWAYSGKTLGPVPVPEPGKRAEFVERIRESFREARYWGWCPDADLADRPALELARIDPANPYPDCLAQLLEAAESAAATGDLLHKAHVLLQYNLEDLADAGHWKQ